MIFYTQVSYLQEQINALVASNEALTNQVYLTGDSANTGSYSNNLIASTWSHRTLAALARLPRVGFLLPRTEDWRSEETPDVDRELWQDRNEEIPHRNTLTGQQIHHHNKTETKQGKEEINFAYCICLTIMRNISFYISFVHCKNIFYSESLFYQSNYLNCYIFAFSNINSWASKSSCLPNRHHSHTHRSW